MYISEQTRTKWAILGPTPGSRSKSSSVLGISPSYFERHMLAIFFMLLAFLVKKATYERVISVT